MLPCKLTIIMKLMAAFGYFSFIVLIVYLMYTLQRESRRKEFGFDFYTNVLALVLMCVTFTLVIRKKK